MKILDLMLKIAGKEKLQIDDKVSNGALARQCVKYGEMALKGTIYAATNKGAKKIVFIGNKVKLYERKNIHLGNKVKLHDGVYIDALSTEGVTLGDGVSLGRNTRIECTGSLNYVGKGVTIGKGSAFGNDCFFGAAGGVTVGEDVIAGQYIRFHSENHNYTDKNMLIRDQGVSHKGIVIGNNCWIGSGAVFLDGACLGDGCVVAANAVVAGAFPDNSVIGGVPAKIIKYR